MVCIESGSSMVLLCFVLFMVASSCCHCASLMRLKALGEFRDSSMLSQGQAKASGRHHGTLIIGQTSLQDPSRKGTQATKNLDVYSNYQADMGWEPNQPKEQANGFFWMKPEAAVEQLLKMEPKVECTQDSMLLQIKDVVSTTKSLLFVDRGNHLSPLPLSMLPRSCGYTVRSTQSNLILVAPYDGCFVALEEESYVLPLRWLGLPVRMSCPLKPSSPDPPMVTCHAAGMVVKMEWTVPVTKIKVMLNGNWEPLMVASSSCGFSVVVHPEGVIISARYAPCLEKKDGMYTLELTGDGETKISCPSLAPVLPEHPKPPESNPELQSEKPKPITVPQLPGFPQKPGLPKPNPAVGQEFKLFYPFFYPLSVFHLQPPASKGPHVQLPEKLVQTKLPLSETPPGPIHPPFYPYNFYAMFLPQGPYQMPKPTPEQVSTTPKGQLKQPLNPLQPGATKAPPQPAAPQGPLYPYPLYHQPEFQSQPAKKPVPKPDLQPSISPVTKTPPKKPGQSEYQSAVKPPDGQVYHLFNPYYYSQHLPPHSAMQHPAPLMQPLQQVTTPASDQTSPETASPQPGNTGIVPPHLWPGSQYTPHMYCSLFCPSRFSNCCSQMAFHQYLNIPFGFGRKDNLPVYPLPPFLPSVTSSGIDSSLGSVPPAQMPAKAKKLGSDTTPTSAPITLQSHPPENIKQPYLQPPDGKPAVLSTSNPSKVAHPEPFYPYFVPNLLYPNWSYFLQKGEFQGSPQSESTSQYNIPWAPAHDPVDPVVQYKPYYVQPPKQQKGSSSSGDMNNSSGQYFMSYISQNQNQHVAKQPNTPAAKELQVSTEKFSDSFANVPKKYTEHGQTVDPDSEPGSYTLLQNGPPGMVKEPLFTFKDLAGDPDLLAQNLPWRRNGKPQNPQNLKPTQGPPQLPTWLEKGLTSALPGSVDYIPRTGDEVESLLLYRPSSVPFFQGPFGAEHPKTKLSEDIWKPMSPLGWNPEKPSQVSGKAFPLWSTAPYHQAHGLNQPIQTEGGNQKQEWLSPT